MAQKSIMLDDDRVLDDPRSRTMLNDRRDFLTFFVKKEDFSSRLRLI